MIKMEKQLLAEYEVKNHLSFFHMMDMVFSGVIFRQHLLIVLHNKSCNQLTRWVNLGLMRRQVFAHSGVYTLGQSKLLGTKSSVELTSSLVLRSALRMEYFLSLELDTPDKILEYVQKGNNCSLRRKGNPAEDVLSRYQTALAGKGIQIPYLTSEVNTAALKRLTYHEIYIDKLTKGDNELVPRMVMYLLRDDDVSKIGKNIKQATDELQAIFYDGGHGLTVAPKFTICKFGEADAAFCERIRRAAAHPIYRGRDEWLSFKCLPSPFTYLAPQNLL